MTRTMKLGRLAPLTLALGVGIAAARLFGQSAQLPTLPPVQVTTVLKWQVIPLQIAGQSNQGGESILLNSETGETWWRAGQEQRWNPMQR